MSLSISSGVSGSIILTGAFGAIIITVAMRRLNGHGLISCLSQALQSTAMVIILVVGAFIFANFMAKSKLPFVLGDLVTTLAVSKYVVLVVIIFIYIVLGMFLDIFSSIVLTIPIIFPAVVAMGFDPIWFGVIMVRIMEIGLITPPIGMNVFVLAGVTDIPLGTIFRGIVPFLIADICHVALLVAVPKLSLFLPDTMF
jgi:C4-dicarboxylate transporter DctM subunit